MESETEIGESRVRMGMVHANELTNPYPIGQKHEAGAQDSVCGPCYIQHRLRVTAALQHRH